MPRKYVLSIMIFICSFYFFSFPISAQEKIKIVINNLIDKELQTKRNQYQNLARPHTMNSDSEEIHAHQDTTYQEPGTAFYLEGGGKFLGSVNVDFPIKKSNRISVGLLLVCPCFMYFYLPGEKKSRIEYGCGFTYIWLGSPEEKRKNSILIHGVIGYRYQKKKGLLFRAGFTPLLFLGKDGGSVVPWIGISLGYSS